MNRRDLLTGGAAAAFVSGLSSAEARQIRAPGVYVDEIPRAFDTVPLPTGVTMFIGHFSDRLGAGASARMSGPGRLPRGFAEVTGLTSEFFAAGGQSLVLMNTGLRADGTPDYETVLAQLSRQFGDDFDLLLLVGAEALYPTQSTRLSSIYQTAGQVAQSRHGMLIVEAPDVADGHRAWLASLSMDSPDIAAWGPHLQVAGGHVIAPGPTIAGIIARTDAREGVWKAPAGLEARIAGYQPSQALSQAQIEAMNDQNINPIRTANGQTVLWGARTMSSDPEWKYIPVRRLSRWIENCAQTGIMWAVFEENNIHTWTRVRDQVERFLNELWRQGALQGARPSEAFYVRCDSTTMTAQDMMNGNLRLELGFAPMRPAEFIVLQLSMEVQRA